MTVKADTTVWKELRKKLRSLGAANAHVDVGVFGTGGEGTSIVEIATIHEFGAPRANIPSRSFLRFTARERREDMVQVLARFARGIIADKMTPHQALDRLGLWFANAVKASIRKRLIYQNLSPRTVARKGSSTALIDTGRLLNAITWKVVD